LDLEPPAGDLATHLSELTFLEFASLVEDLDIVTDADELRARVKAAHEKGTLALQR